MSLLECSTIEQLGCELSRNCNLRKLCGFNDVYIICLDMLTMNYL